MKYYSILVDDFFALENTHFLVLICIPKSQKVEKLHTLAKKWPPGVVLEEIR
jgi:hypothetical protein